MIRIMLAGLPLATIFQFYLALLYENKILSHTLCTTCAREIYYTKFIIIIFNIAVRTEYNDSSQLQSCVRSRFRLILMAT